MARNTTFRLGTTSGRRRSSRKDWWLAARMAAPSVGMLSSPTASGLYSSRRTGPSNTYFISHQNKGVTSSDRPRPSGFPLPE